MVENLCVHRLYNAIPLPWKRAYLRKRISGENYYPAVVVSCSLPARRYCKTMDVNQNSPIVIHSDGELGIQSCYGSFSVSKTEGRKLNREEIVPRNHKHRSLLLWRIMTIKCWRKQSWEKYLDNSHTYLLSTCIRADL